LRQLYVLLIALTLPSHNHLFRGKPDGELWASEKNDLCAAISTGILGRVGGGRVLGSSFAQV
jgi:hypothetical protein